jgi:hypothetical protein
LQHRLATVDVDVIHPRLVADRVEDEGQMYEGVDLVALEQLAHPVAIADVGPDELVLGPAARRRAKIDVDDLLGLLASRELVGQPPADVARASCDQVPHTPHPIRGPPILASRPRCASDRSPFLGCGKSAAFTEFPRNYAEYRNLRRKSC